MELTESCFRWVIPLVRRTHRLHRRIGHAVHHLVHTAPYAVAIPCFSLPAPPPDMVSPPPLQAELPWPQPMFEGPWLPTAYLPEYGGPPLSPGEFTTLNPTGASHLPPTAEAGPWQQPPSPTVATPEPSSLALVGFWLALGLCIPHSLAGSRRSSGVCK